MHLLPYLKINSVSSCRATPRWCVSLPVFNVYSCLY